MSQDIILYLDNNGRNDINFLTRTGCEKWEKLLLFKKQLCWLFYRVLRTGNRERFNPVNNAHKSYLKASGTVKSYIKSSDY